MKNTTTPQIYTVSQITREINDQMEGRFSFVRVSGEITNLRKPFSGHIYFTLKDDSAQLKAVLFKGAQRFLQGNPENGMQVICHGRITVYQPRGEYQIIIDTIDFHGAGSLQAEFEQLKKRLADHGFFDSSRKQDIPPYPKHIFLVTSPSGAAVHDFLTIHEKRKSTIPVSLYPVSVQGDGAGKEIANAIRVLNQKFDQGIIVLTRGGGSMEDLWAFNEEQVAMAISGSSMVVVTGIGHEIDFTIADFCADLRAPTPTGAAEMIVPDQQALVLHLQTLKKRLGANMLKQLEQAELQIITTKRFLGDMEGMFTHFSLRLDYAATSLSRGITSTINIKEQRFQQAAASLLHQEPGIRLTVQEQQVNSLRIQLQEKMVSIVRQKEAKLGRQATLLDAVSPLATLGRGYSITRKKKSGTRQLEVITKSSQVQPGDELEVLLHRGRLQCKVTALR